MFRPSDVRRFAVRVSWLVSEIRLLENWNCSSFSSVPPCIDAQYRRGHLARHVGVGGRDVRAPRGSRNSPPGSSVKLLSWV